MQDATIPAGYSPSWYKATVNLFVNVDEQDWGISNEGKRNKFSGDIDNGPDGTSLPFWPSYHQGIMGSNTLAVGPFIDVLKAGIPNVVSHVFQEAALDGTTPVGATGEVGSQGTIPVAVSEVGSPTYVGTVTIVCERTDAAYKAWQLQQYEAVVTACESWKQEFETAVRTAQSAAAVNASPSKSTNSELAGTLITTEIRRLFLQMLGVPAVGIGGGVSQFDTSDPVNPKAPVLNPPQAAIIGRQIQFVEQAFEWPQLTYRLYPYYWKPAAVWKDAMLLDDPDPDFAEFLRAGSARIVVPVRPGFEVAVCSHLGISPPMPWQAGQPPILDGDPYISIAEEIKSAQTSLVAPVRVDKPWIVRLPTTLVKLKDDHALPVFRDPTPPDPAPDDPAPKPPPGP
jgi:hypothetical protein